jgi:hypothetical protein
VSAPVIEAIMVATDREHSFAFRSPDRVIEHPAR